MSELSPGDQRAAGVVARLVFREGLYECFDVVVIGGESVYEMGDRVWLTWRVGYSGS